MDNTLIKNNIANSTPSTINGVNFSSPQAPNAPTEIQSWAKPLMTPQTSTIDIPNIIPSNTLFYKQPTGSSIEEPINATTKSVNALSDAIMTTPVNQPPQPTDRESILQERQKAIDLYTNPDTGYSATSNRLTNESGIVDKTSQLNALNVKDIALQKQLKDYQDSILNKNPQGLFGGAGQQAISQYERDISSQRADLAIQKLALQGDISTAQMLIKNKLDAEFEPIKNRIDYLDKTLSIYNNDLTDKEKEKLIIEKQNLQDLQSEKNKFQAISDDAGKAGAPIDIINKANNLFAKGNRAGAIYLLSPYTKSSSETVGAQTTFDENGNVIQSGNYDALTIGRYNKAFNAASQNLVKNQTYKNIVSGSAYLDRIEAAKNNPGSVGDQELLDAFTQLNTGGNRVTEAQVHLITNNQSISDWLSKIQNKFKNGGALSQQQRNEITELANEVYKNYQKSYLPLYNETVARAKAQGIPQEFWNIPSPDTLSRAANESVQNNNINLPSDNELMKKYNLTPEELQQYKSSRGLNSVGGDTKKASQGITRAQRNNNPLNIKISNFTKNFEGVVGTDSKPAADGGKFITFNSPQAGFNAGVKLLKTPGYLNLDVDKAMKRWSNNGYGVDVAPQFAGRKIKDLSDEELQTLIQLMAKREGYYNNKA